MTNSPTSEGVEDHGGISPTFLGLPRELRMLIYDILVGNRTYWINFPHDGCSTQTGVIGSLSLLRVNRQVHDEALRVMRVKTLRVNKFGDVDYRLLTGMPDLFKRWGHTIDHVTIGYYPREFKLMTNSRHEHNTLEDPFLMNNLRLIINHLPKLRSLSITSGDVGAAALVELESRFITIARELKESLPDYHHITASITDFRTPYGRNWDSEIRFLRRAETGKTWVSDTSARADRSLIYLSSTIARRPPRTRVEKYSLK